MNNSVCCVIVTYNCSDEFLNTFNSVINQVDEIVIVDNGSRYDTKNILISLENKAKVIFLDDNMGIAAALNIGVKYAIENHYDWVITLDNDSIMDDKMIGKLLSTYDTLNDKQKREIVSLMPQYLEMGVHDYNENIKSGTIEVECGITSGNLIKINIFKKVGMFNEKLFIDYVDNEFCYRIIKLGYKILQVNDAILYHRLGEVEERKFLNSKVRVSNHSVIRRYYITRNRLYCWKKYSKLAPKTMKLDKLSFIKETIKIILYEKEKKLKIRMILKGYKDYKKNIFGKFIQ